MPNGEIPISNPPPLPSHLPDSVLQLAVQPQQKRLPDHVRQSLRDFQHAAEYIAAGKPTCISLLRYIEMYSTVTDGCQQ